MRHTNQCGGQSTGQEDYTVVETLIVVEVEVLVFAQADTIAQLQAKSVTDTLTPN